MCTPTARIIRKLAVALAAGGCPEDINEAPAGRECRRQCPDVTSDAWKCWVEWASVDDAIMEAHVGVALGKEDPGFTPASEAG